MFVNMYAYCKCHLLQSSQFSSAFGQLCFPQPSYRHKWQPHAQTPETLNGKLLSLHHPRWWCKISGMDVVSKVTTSHVAKPTATYLEPLGLCNHESNFISRFQPPTPNKKKLVHRKKGIFFSAHATQNLRAEQQAINRIHRLNSPHQDVYFFKLLSENNSAERRMLMGTVSC